MKSKKAANKKSRTNSRQDVNFQEAIRMKFLEQSAKYLGVYVKNRPADYRYLNEHLLN